MSYELSNTLYKIICRCCWVLALVTAMLVTRAQEVIADTVIEETAEPYVPDEDYGDDYSTADEPYVPDTPALRQVPAAMADSLKRDKDFAYANDSDYWKREPEKKRTRSENKGFWYHFYEFFASTTVRVFAYLLIGGLIIYLIFKAIVQNNLYIFYNSKKLAVAEAGDEAEMDPETLDEKLKMALAEKNHRMAVRFYYLKALQMLNNKGFIRLHAQATNYQYLQQMSSNRLANEFRFLTDVYDYVWYGEFPLTENQFERVDTNFRSFFQAIKS